MNLTVIEAVERHDRNHCYAIRTEVFCGEQRVSRDIEFDGLDGECRHYLALVNESPVGTARTRPIGDGHIKFERIAVQAKYRGRGVGNALMARGLEDAAAEGVTECVLNAQLAAVEFYEKLGFVRRGRIFPEAGIDHVHMVRGL